MNEREELYRRALGLPPDSENWSLDFWTVWRCLHPPARSRLDRWWRDFRFNLGYRVGGFRSASREPR